MSVWNTIQPVRSRKVWLGFQRGFAHFSIPTRSFPDFPIHDKEMENKKHQIGFIGLGIMGKPMVKNLIMAGYEPIVFNRGPAPVDELVGEGARREISAKNVAEQSDVVITMLPDTPDVESVVLGADGIIEGARPGLLLIDMSTISPVSTREIASRIDAKNVRMLDAPVSGGDKGAVAGTLSIMRGGTKSEFEEARPIFEAVGKTIVHCG